MIRQGEAKTQKKNEGGRQDAWRDRGPSLTAAGVGSLALNQCGSCG